ncbi:hypothetical protein PoB_000333500 [Plakobranchus ocellatus]|uniref:Reverse transcriptase domain-containing protein n=1 Tax=Plakobranchus ocellatus TaxID=259542 RepID=A0AAV3Y1P8_9GAST|nr:hypothetical protein PoB_000333500 [Plakobranchus ocellatus]
MSGRNAPTVPVYAYLSSLAYLSSATAGVFSAELEESCSINNLLYTDDTETALFAGSQQKLLNLLTTTVVKMEERMAQY